MSLGTVLLAASALGTRPTPVEIIGGVLTEPGEFESVVAIFMGGDFCTGTVVAPGLILTAAHCLDGRPIGSISVAVGQQVHPNVTIPINDYGIHPDYCRECSPRDPDIFDYGYVILPPEAIDVTEFAELIVEQKDWDAVLNKGGEIEIVGYGLDNDGRVHSKRKVVTSIRSQSASGQEFYAGGDFRDSCTGDSGGPAFVRLPDGRRMQAGIVSRGSRPCGEGGVYATPYPALEWLQAETGIAFCGSECGDCNCLDTTPDPDAQGCGCQQGPEPEEWWLVVPMLVMLGRRRLRM